MCFAPLVLIGYALTVQTDWHKTQNVDAPMIEVQTCEQGVGAHLKASAAGLYALGVHYGFHGEAGPWSVTFQPQAGFSYADHPIDALPMRTQFELGAQFTVGYERLRIGVEYLHFSNAGLKSPNIGLDMIVLQTGWRF